jgi:ubiquinone/menaquinone biosynthesis C-methylase UbiE
MGMKLWRKVVAIMLLLPWNLASAQLQTDTKHHRFDNIERWVQIFESPDRDKWQKPKEVIKALKLKPGDIIADIGAGTGYFTRRLALAVFPTGKALGLDIEPSMVKYMKEDAHKLGLNNYKARIVGPDAPGLKPQSVDLIFLCNTYHHIKKRETYFKKLIQALKRGGRVVIIDFQKRSLPVGPPPEKKISKDQVIREFSQAGYRLVRFLDFLPYQYFLEFEPVKGK